MDLICSASFLLAPFSETRRNAYVEMACSYNVHTPAHLTTNRVFQFIPTSVCLFAAIQSASCNDEDHGYVQEPVDEYTVPSPFTSIILQTPQLDHMKPLARAQVEVESPQDVAPDPTDAMEGGAREAPPPRRCVRPFDLTVSVVRSDRTSRSVRD
mmetsp:Transcript_3758/g.23640  ORF Transcript_3758/g.23640 Transcript_3758/m.23640 type:complete len:155 (-) Transcript_3758:880-1344(-)